MREKLRAAGVPVECRIYTGAGHMPRCWHYLRCCVSRGALWRTCASSSIALSPLAPRRSRTPSNPCPNVRGRKEWERPLPQPTLVELSL
jgi:hypothetical protein